jgi:hypothetical protein
LPRIVLKAVARPIPGTTKFTVKMVEVKVPDFKYAYLTNSEMAPPPRKRRKTKMEKRRIRKRFERERDLRKTG